MDITTQNLYHEKIVIFGKKISMTNTSKLKEDLHHIIDQIEDQAILEAVHTLLTSQIGTIYSLQGQALDQDSIEARLEESEADIEAGRTVSQQELKAKIQSWRKQNNAK
jgi:predicted transcriptional regulator